MTMFSPEFRRLLRSMENHFAKQADHSEDKAIAAHMVTVTASLGKPSKHRKGRTEPMPYRLHIAIAFVALASALASLYAWYQ